MFCKTEDADVEIIVDADATIQLEIEMIDIETSDPIDDDFYAQYNSTNTSNSNSNTPRKQSLWQGFGEPPISTDVNPHAAVTAVPKESGHLKPDDIQARCIEVMDSVGSPSPSHDR